MATFTPAPNRFSVIPDFNSYPGVSGFGLTVTGATTFTLSPGYARSLIADFSISFPSFAPNTPAILSLDVSTTGALGCFPVSLASLGLAHDTIFPVYVLGNSAGTTGGSLSQNADAVTAIVATGNNFLISPEYDQYRRVGYVYIDHTTGHIIPMQQSGNNNLRTYVLQDPIVALSAGASTTPAVIDLTANDGLIPANKTLTVLLNVAITPAAADGYVCVEPGTLTAATVTPVQIFGSVASHENSSFVEMTATPNASTGNANIQYFVDNGSSASTINVVGFVDDLANALL